MESYPFFMQKSGHPHLNRNTSPMKPFSIIIYGTMLLVVCSCASGHKSAASSTSANRGAVDTAYGLPDSLRDGSSFANAIVINEATETAGVDAEYKWIRGNQPGFKTTMQSLRFYKGRSYDVLHIKNAEGAEKDIYFDISRYFGKF